MSEKAIKKAKSKSDKELKKLSKKEKQNRAGATPALSLLASEKALDAGLSSLFAVKQPAIKANNAPVREYSAADLADVASEDEDDLSSLDEDFDDEAEVGDAEMSDAGVKLLESEEVTPLEEQGESRSRRKRKRKDGDDLEDQYMNRVAREEAKDAARLATQRAAKRQKAVDEDEADEADEEDEDQDGDDAEDDNEATEDVDGLAESEDEEEAGLDLPPKHETQVAADEELAKANRTVFLGNVSTSAITSKVSRKALMTHLGSFFSELPTPRDDSAKPKIESIRFRSTPYASSIPKKAAFAKQELMDATTKSTNAYAVYSTPALAREAAKRLNGTVVLGRHLRVDEIAHPAKVDNRRCVFVGNLGFVDDETNIQDANEEEGREKRKRGKEPADVEEGLWRTFGKCGTVESVRVIRDSTTRVGKGIAYVQFTDENAVEAALLLNEKKFPPMLPRKLRVSRAKAPKRNVKPGSGRPTTKPKTHGYQRKITAEEASKMGRAGKLLGRAAAAQMRKPDRTAPPSKSRPTLGDGIKKPEAFIFEGHRASARQGKSGLKLGGKSSSKKKVKVTKRSASFKSKKKAS